MLKLEAIIPSAQLCGILANDIVHIITTAWVGTDALTIYYKDSQGKLGEQLLFRSDEERLSLAQEGRVYAFDADGAKFRLALEAYRIAQAALFDPMMAVHTSNVEPLPHQISAVYEAMLPRQPLRFVLADDPGAGKTIMAGLLIRELLIRADAQRILIVAPGSLCEQWQDEMLEKFNVEFTLFSREKQEQSPSGNYFADSDHLICRLDQLSRNADYQAKLKSTAWDLIIVDEAHKLSANYGGNKINKSKRFQLGELLGSISRHFLLMTATPHNGKEADFQIWLSLLDGDRFYGKFREGVHKVDVSDMMRRMVKEELLKFDGKPLFPERRAYTANYTLSLPEAALYEQVTTYVREEMNRADNLDGQKKNNVGFALTMLQRRLASSPEAIYQSLKRRRERLENRLSEARLLARGEKARQHLAETLGTYYVARQIDLPESMDELDEELGGGEYETYVEQVVDQASASETIPELEAEIHSLQYLERQAQQVVQSGSDTKWDQLSALLQDEPHMKDTNGQRRKLIIFTEHKDTLHYLAARITNLLGSAEGVRTISGSTNRDERRKIQEEFRHNPAVLILIATDAAGEGVNLQNANLMINYDLPWNPNRIEQRFGRIHRIGQTEVCHLWNLVAKETREGEVFQKLFDKIETVRATLKGKVFDILGEAFADKPLRELLLDAIRYGEQPEVKARMDEVIAGALDIEHLHAIIRRNALAEQTLQLEDLYHIKEEMDKAEARRLQPYFIHAFFKEAFAALGGSLHPREAGRYEITYVPARIRDNDRVISESRTPVLKKYARICFDKQHIRPVGKALADFIHPAHPLLHSIIDLTLQEHRSKLKQGAILLDPNDMGSEPGILYMIEHVVRDGDGTDISRRLQFVHIDRHGNTRYAGWAPHLDLVPLKNPADDPHIRTLLHSDWLNHGDGEQRAIHYAATHIAPAHYREVQARRSVQADKTLAAVHERLVKEINYQQDRYLKLQDDIKAGKNPRQQPEILRQRIDELTTRLEQRTAALRAMKNIVSATPVIISSALVLPQGWFAEDGAAAAENTVDAAARARVEQLAMQAVMDTEAAFGHAVTDVSAEKCGWDITARPAPHADGSLPDDRHIEVKGRAKGQTTITVSRNEIMYALNQADKYLLAIVIVDGDKAGAPRYIKNPFTAEPDFGVTGVDYDLAKLLAKSVPPAETL